MVEDTINKYEDLTNEIRGLKEVKFLALAKMDDLTDRWTILFGLLGAKNLDKRAKYFSKFRDIIIKNLDEKDMQMVARIGLFPTTDHMVKDLMKFSENEHISEVKANGNYIHEGYILISNKTGNTK